VQAVLHFALIAHQAAGSIQQESEYRHFEETPQLVALGPA
jgi:hypothetical protein